MSADRFPKFLTVRIVHTFSQTILEMFLQSSHIMTSGRKNCIYLNVYIRISDNNNFVITIPYIVLKWATWLAFYESERHG